MEKEKKKFTRNIKSSSSSIKTSLAEEREREISWRVEVYIEQLNNQ